MINLIRKVLRDMMLCLVLIGCGNEISTETQIQNIVWSGSIDENTELFDKFMKTRECLKETFPEAMLHEGYPNVNLVIAPIVCGDNLKAFGCTVFAIDTIEIMNSLKSTWVPSHENIHWLTGTRDELSPYFSCTIF